MHIVKNKEEYVIGTDTRPGIISKMTKTLIHDVSQLLTPIRAKFRQICLYDEWRDWQHRNDFECPDAMKEYHSRNVKKQNIMTAYFLSKDRPDLFLIFHFGLDAFFNL